MFRNKTVTKIISFLIAFALWGYVVWDTNPTIETTIKDVPVNILNEALLEEQGLAIVQDQDHDNEYTVDVKVSGRKKDIGSLTKSEVYASIDVSGYAAGEASVPVHVSLPENITAVSITPGNITVTIDSALSEEKDVRSSIAGELPGDLELVSITPSADSVTVTGAKSKVDTVAYVRADLSADEAGDGETVTSVKLVPVDQNGDEVKNVSLSQDAVDVTTVIYSTKTVSLSIRSVGEPAENVKATHLSMDNTITIRGSKEALADLTEISGTVDITGISETTVLRAQLDLPSGVSLSKSERTPEVTVTVDLADGAGESAE